jgi:hypothetical protein
MAVKKKTSRKAERRRSTRVDAKLSMRVEGAHDGGHAKIVTETQNISASGVYATASHYLPPLSKVQLTLVIPRIPGATRAQNLLKCEGIVVRCEMSPDKRRTNPYDLACMFAEADEQRRDLLEAFVTWRNLQALRAAVAPSPRRPAVAKKKAAARPAKPKATRAKAATARKVAPRAGAAKSTRKTVSASTRRPTGARRSAR